MKTTVRRVNAAALPAGVGVRLDTYPEPFAAMTERQWMSHVIGFARLHAWTVYHTHDSRRSVKGFPDLVLAKEGRPVVYAELKTETGKPTAEQQGWLALLRLTPSQAFLWRPRDWEQVVKVLGTEV